MNSSIVDSAKADCSTPPDHAIAVVPLPLVRCGAAGVLMGMANLVPGVSGGTMILVMGLYDEFIAAVADVTCLRFTRRNIMFLAVVGGAAVVTIASLAGLIREWVTAYQSAMYALFIGMTLGGAPALTRRLRGFDWAAGSGLALGLAILIAIALTGDDVTGSTKGSASGSPEAQIVQAAYVRDFLAGAVGICAMVLPGISGAYMLLLIGRYEAILASISSAKDAAMTFGGDPVGFSFLHILVPVAMGAALSLVAASNFLRWMLRKHPQPVLGFLLGILLGSVVGLWPFHSAMGAVQVSVTFIFMVGGFTSTFFLSLVSR
jgi:putative membrane protein